jgi:hypothetical protein
MTIIAYCGKFIASDSLSTWGEYRNYDAIKLVTRGNTVFAACGLIALIEPMIEWYLDGTDPLTCPAAYKDDLTTELIAISPSFRDDNEVLPIGYRVATNNPFPFRIPTPFASGCMNDFAMGAMAAGKNAVEAVHLCCENGTHIAPPVLYVDLLSLPYVVKVSDQD